MELDRKRIGKRLRDMRKKIGLTQEDMGEVLNLSKNHISDMERGCSLPTVKVLMCIYVQFGVSPDQLLLGTEREPLDELSRKMCDLSDVGRRLIVKQLDLLLEEGL